MFFVLKFGILKIYLSKEMTNYRERIFVAQFLLYGDVVVQFYPWFNFYFPLFMCMVMYDNELKTRENKNGSKDKIEPKWRQYSGITV